MRDILVVVRVMKFKLLTTPFFLKEKFRREKAALSALFFFVLSSSSCKKSLHHNSFIIRTSLSLSLSAIYTNIKRQKERVIK